jgi:hypothetical protein
MTIITAIDTERIAHVNFVMDDIHSSVNTVYECMIDNDSDELKKELKRLIKTMRAILESLEDEG